MHAFKLVEHSLISSATEKADLGASAASGARSSLVIVWVLFFLF